MEEQAAARDESARATGAKCSEATLHGTYLFAVAGYEVYDGNGKVRGVSSGNFGGEVFRKDPFSGTYSVKEDCTGTSHYKDDSQYDLFISPDGSMFTVVQTHPPEVVASGLERQVTAKRVGD
jgi:hypothetical protein